MVAPACFIIAEAGVNHNGKVKLAKELVELAAQAGADAVKFQTFKSDRLVTRTAPKAAYQRRHTQPDESQGQMLRRLELSEADHRELWDHCQRRGIRFLSTPFEEESADFLERLGVLAFKIASSEVTNFPFLAHVARKGKPIFLSTGMSNLEEVRNAVRAIEQTGNRELTLLHCVSSYPAHPNDANLRAMISMAEAFGYPVGYSDHTPGVEVALAAVALGACVIEKHFTLDRQLPGPDQKSSLEPRELEELVKGIRVVESALGHGRKEPSPAEQETAQVARKSLVASRNIPAGTTLTQELIQIKRPGTGLPPSMREVLLGRIALTDIPADTLLKREMFK